MSVPRKTTVVSLIEALENHFTTEIKRVEGKLRTLQGMLIAMMLTNNATNLQSFASHAKDVMPSIIRVVLGWIRL